MVDHAARRRRLKLPAFCLLLTLGLLPGCAGHGFDLGEVTGTVSINGKPTQGLMLTFQPDSPTGTTSVGYTNAEGKYVCHFTRQAMGAIVGKHTVSINHYLPDDAPRDAVRYRVPKRYNTESELHVDVKPGKNNFDFDLILDNGKKGKI